MQSFILFHVLQALFQAWVVTSHLPLDEWWLAMQWTWKEPTVSEEVKGGSWARVRIVQPVHSTNHLPRTCPSPRSPPRKDHNWIRYSPSQYHQLLTLGFNGQFEFRGQILFKPEDLQAYSLEKEPTEACSSESLLNYSQVHGQFISQMGHLDNLVALGLKLWHSRTSPQATRIPEKKNNLSQFLQTLFVHLSIPNPFHQFGWAYPRGSFWFYSQWFCPLRIWPLESHRAELQSSFTASEARPFAS